MDKPQGPKHFGGVTISAISTQEIQKCEQLFLRKSHDYQVSRDLDETYRLNGFHDRMEAYFARICVLHWHYKKEGSQADAHMKRRSRLESEVHHLRARFEMLKRQHEKDSEYADRVALGAKFLRMTPEQKAAYNAQRKKKG